MSWSFKQKLYTSNLISTATARLLVEVLAGEITANNLKTKKSTFKQIGIDDHFNGWTISLPSKHSSQRINNFFLKNKKCRQIQTD